MKTISLPYPSLMSLVKSNIVRLIQKGQMQKMIQALGDDKISPLLESIDFNEVDEDFKLAMMQVFDALMVRKGLSFKDYHGMIEMKKKWIGQLLIHHVYSIQRLEENQFNDALGIFEFVSEDDLILSHVHKEDESLHASLVKMFHLWLEERTSEVLVLKMTNDQIQNTFPKVLSAFSQKEIGMYRSWLRCDVTPHFQISAVQAFLRIINDEENKFVRFKAMCILQSYVQVRSTEYFQDIVIPNLLKLLEDSDEVIRQKAVVVIGDWPKKELSDDLIHGMMKGLVEALDDQDAMVRKNAVEALGEWFQEGLPDHYNDQVMHGVLTRFEDSDWCVRKEAVEALVFGSHFEGFDSIKDRVISSLLERLQDPFAAVRNMAFKTLGTWSRAKLSMEIRQKVLQTLFKSIQDEDKNVRRKAIQALGIWSKADLLEQERTHVMEGIFISLSDYYWGVRYEVIKILGTWSRSELSMEIRQKMAEALLTSCEDKDESVRQEAVKVLGSWSRSELAKDIRQKMTEALLISCKDEDEDVRKEAIGALGAWFNADGTEEEQSKVIQRVVEALADPDWSVREGAVKVLGSWSRSELAMDLRKSVVQILLWLCGDEDEGVRQEAIKALGEWSKADLPEEEQSRVVQGILASLSDSAWCVCKEVSEVLSRLSVNETIWQHQVLEKLLERFKDVDVSGVQKSSIYDHQKYEAVELLGDWSCQTLKLQKKPIIELLLRILNHSNDQQLRVCAIESLANWLREESSEDLKASILDGLLSALEDEHDGVRIQASQVLVHWAESSLSGALFLCQSIMEKTLLCDALRWRVIQGLYALRASHPGKKVDEYAAKMLEHMVDEREIQEKTDLGIWPPTVDMEPTFSDDFYESKRGDTRLSPSSTLGGASKPSIFGSL